MSWALASCHRWAFILLLMYPGAIAFTLIPSGAHSLASALVSWATPPLLAA